MAEELLARNYTHFGGQQAETASLTNILRAQGVHAPHNNQPFSEALLLGIGGGLGAGYILWEFAAHNVTRFLIMSPAPEDADNGNGPVITSFIFKVRNVPAALYKALGGFATNGVNMTKLESYQLEGSFNATQFYADIEGHPEERNVRLALEELQFFTASLKVLGVYPAHPFRRTPR